GQARRTGLLALSLWEWRTNMGQTIGVLATRQVAVGVVEDNALIGPIRVFPEEADNPDTLRTMTGDEIAELIGEQVLQIAGERQIDSVGVGFPGVIRNGVVEESPNLQQIKGFAFAAALCGVLGRGGGHLEGIMGHRAMRLRFLDMEPEEVFAAAREGDVRCSTFVKRWHRAL